MKEVKYTSKIKKVGNGYSVKVPTAFLQYMVDAEKEYVVTLTELPQKSTNAVTETLTRFQDYSCSNGLEMALST